MNDPGTGAKHMGASYLWRTSKRGQRAHIENPETGRAHCQAENCSGGKAFDGRGSGIPDGRRVCGNCTNLAGWNETDYQEPNLAVLLGERIAEAQAPLFTEAPKPWEREKPAQSDHGSKGYKPKRSDVKHPRPFDDPLPW